jgi:hypothetical protein
MNMVRERKYDYGIMTRKKEWQQGRMNRGMQLGSLKHQLPLLLLQFNNVFLLHDAVFCSMGCLALLTYE